VPSEVRAPRPCLLHKPQSSSASSCNFQLPAASHPSCAITPSGVGWPWVLRLHTAAPFEGTTTRRRSWSALAHPSRGPSGEASLTEEPSSSLSHHLGSTRAPPLSPPLLPACLQVRMSQEVANYFVNEARNSLHRSNGQVRAEGRPPSLCFLSEAFASPTFAARSLLPGYALISPLTSSILASSFHPCVKTWSLPCCHAR